VGADSSLPLIQTRARTSDINRRSLICVIGIILQFRLLQVGVKPHLRLAVARHGHPSIQTPTSVGVKRFVIVPLKVDAKTSIRTPTKAGVKQWMRNRLHPHRSSFNSNSCSTGVKRSVRLWVRRGIGFLQCKPLLYRSETRGGMLPAALRPNPSIRTPALTGVKLDAVYKRRLLRTYLQFELLLTGVKPLQPHHKQEDIALQQRKLRKPQI
jgi:hypothetical protein